MNFKNINTGISESRLIKVFFQFFLFIFLSHYVHQTLDIFFSDINQELIVNVGDFDSEEESNENEEELEEIDDYLVSVSLLSFDNFLNSSKISRLYSIPLMPCVEVDLPPPLI